MDFWVLNNLEIIQYIWLVMTLIGNDKKSKQVKGGFLKKIHATLKLQYCCIQIFTWLQKSVLLLLLLNLQALAFFSIKFIFKLMFYMGAPGLHSTSVATPKEGTHFFQSQSWLGCLCLGLALAYLWIGHWLIRSPGLNYLLTLGYSPKEN